MLIPAIILAVVVVLFLLIYNAIRPASRKHEDLRLLEGALIAHRGLHNAEKGIPENSLPAFEAACQAGYAIETDVHITQDGQAIVFHDHDLKRMCGVDGVVEHMTLADIRRNNLSGTKEVAPTLDELLRLVKGRVPLVLELKCAPHKQDELCNRVFQHMASYSGKYMVQSFDPRSLRWFRRHAPKVCRGQLASNFLHKSPEGKHYGLGAILVGFMLCNHMSRPDYVAYDARFAANPMRRLVCRMGAFPVGWTFESDEQLREGRKHFHCWIFQNFDPKQH